MEKKKCSAKTIIAMILQVLLGIFFIYNGVVKWMDINAIVGFFGTVGYPAWLAYAVAAFELIGGVLVLFPRVAFQGSALIIIVMIGAIYTLISGGSSFLMMLPAILSLLAAITVAVIRVEGCLIYKKMHKS